MGWFVKVDMTVVMYSCCCLMSNDYSPEVWTWFVPGIACTVDGCDINQERNIWCIHVVMLWRRWCVLIKWQFCVVKWYNFWSVCICGEQGWRAMRIVESTIVCLSMVVPCMSTENGAGGLPVSFFLYLIFLVDLLFFLLFL